MWLPREGWQVSGAPCDIDGPSWLPSGNFDREDATVAAKGGDATATVEELIDSSSKTEGETLENSRLTPSVILRRVRRDGGES